ncbi:MAG: alpha/beta fold hydrolase, partial [Planctomycetia bacterium]|nr:alpha/beta fold hydrolase [Planctomycetia bacterium]
GITVPLETDLTTPLVCFMSTPEAQLMPTLGLVRPDELLKTVPKEKDSPKSTRIIKGMYMMEPYDPNRIPVVLIHGLWSSPFTWMEMFNSLRSDETIRKKYQFWFYFYPSGQPFWVSAAQLRDDLREVRHTLDPQKQIASFDEMVLVGHSMGGLIARLQVMSAQDHFWNRVSTVPFDQTKLEQDTRSELSKWFFFEPNPSVRRIVTIATPFEGSRAANSVSQWFAQRMISIPGQLTHVIRSFTSSDNGYLSKDSLLEVKTSVESLSPECPVYQAMAASRISGNVACNNIVGVWHEDSAWPMRPKPGDGVVEIESAHRTDVESEAVVQAPHMQIHMHPATILETRRVLLEHLRVMRSEQAGNRPTGGQVFASQPQAEWR